MSGETLLAKHPGRWHSVALLPEALRQIDADHWMVVALAALTFVLSGAYALTTPAFLGPDEEGHFQYVESLFRSGGEAITGTERYQPAGYYLVASAGYALSAGQPREVQLVAVRLVSATLLLFEVVFAYLVGRMLSPSNRFVYLSTAAIVALLPGRSWIAGTVNNDNLASLASAAILYATVCGITRGLCWKTAFGLALAVLIAVMSKVTVWPVVMIAGVFTAAIVVRRPWGMRAEAGWFTPALLVGSGLVTLVALLRGSLQLQAHLNSVFSSWRRFLDIPPVQPEPFIFQFKSFWMPVWRDDYAPPDVGYQLALVLMLVAGAGLLLRALRSLARWQPGRLDRKRAACIALLVLVAVAVSLSPIVRYLSVVAGTSSFHIGRYNMWAMHGRFLFPALVPLAYLSAVGLGQLVLPSARSLGLAVLVTILLLLNSIALFSVVSSFYWWP